MVSATHKEDIATIIRSKEPLTDDGGKEFAEAVVRLILGLSNTEGKIQGISSGSSWVAKIKCSPRNSY
jgi:hypothetical protein